jgi:protein-S-isoprenylcysteine O-methyltransferase Ste14
VNRKLVEWLLRALVVLEAVAFGVALLFVAGAFVLYVIDGPTVQDLRAARSTVASGSARAVGAEVAVEGRSARAVAIPSRSAASYVSAAGPLSLLDELARGFVGHGWAITAKRTEDPAAFAACRGPMSATVEAGGPQALQQAGRSDAVLVDLRAGVVPFCPAAGPPPREFVSLGVVASFVLFLVVATYVRASGLRRRGQTVRRSGGLESILTAGAWLPYAVVALRLGPELEPPAWLVWVGLALTLGGIAFAVWSVLTLGRHYDLELEVHEGHEVVRAGPYGLVRHPVYLGLAAHSLGAVLATGNVLLAIGTLAVTLPLFYLRAVTEEALLRAELGEAYGAYTKEVPMLVPGGPR